MKGMVLAAGKGTRFRPFTDNIAKPAIPFLGVPTMHFAFYWLSRLGVSEFVVNTHHQPDSVETAAAGLFEEGFFNFVRESNTDSKETNVLELNKKSSESAKYKLSFTSEQPEILDSAGGIKNAQSHLEGGGTFCVANGDSPLFILDDLSAMLEEHKSSGALATLMALDHELPFDLEFLRDIEVAQVNKNHSPELGGLWVNENKKILGIGGEEVAACRSFRFPGLAIYDDRIFDLIPEGQPSHIFNDVLLPAIESGEIVNAYTPRGFWLETGNESDYLLASRIVLEILGDTNHEFNSALVDYYNALPKFEYSYQKNGDDIVLRADDSLISGKISGACVLGPGVEVPPGVHVHNSVIMSNNAFGDSEEIHTQFIL